MRPTTVGPIVLKSLLMLLAISFLYGPPAKGEADPPAVITAPEVKQMMEDNGALLVHVLSRIEYEGQHIPGSINIPINEMATSIHLPEDTGRTLIFYCMGQR